MSKASSAAALFLEKNQTQPTKAPFKEAFETLSPGKVSNFRGMFGHIKLSKEQEQELFDLLQNFNTAEKKRSNSEIDKDFERLLEITSSVQGIKAQSILLQGEQIKAAQLLLKNYQEGAFTKWLLTSYGNRQTPYSILQYYEFYQKLSPLHRQKIELMPKKAAYTLAAREAEMEKKMHLLDLYQPDQKPADTILLVQETFPKKLSDKRKGASFAKNALARLELLYQQLLERKESLNFSEKKALKSMAKALINLCE